MDVTKYDCEVTFTTPILGSQPGRDDPASVFIRKQTKENHPEIDIPEEEVESLPEELKKGTTGFYRTKEDKPCFHSYQIKGGLKAAASLLNGAGGNKNLRSKIQDTLFICPIIIPINFSEEIKILERPLRGMTMQGPRVSLARSEMIDEGATIHFVIETIAIPKFEIKKELLTELLDYSAKLGIGQWRNSGEYGMFTYKLK